MASSTPAEASGTDTPGGTDPASAAAPPSRRSALLRSGLIIGILLVVFLIIIPRFVDYQDVFDAFRALTLQQILIMTALAAVGYVLSGLLFVAVIPNLGILRGGICYLILSGIGSSVPFGPWNMGVTWVILRGWGTPNRPATSGIALYGLISWLARVALPLVGLVLLAVTGGLDPSRGPAFTIAMISSIAFVVVVILVFAIVRSDRVADWLGRTGQRLSGWVMARLGRKEGPNVSGSIHHFRDQVGEVLERRGAVALVAGIIGQIGWAIVLIVALRIMGIPESVLPPAEVFAVYALVSVITIIPISPGGAGIPELLFIAGLSAIAGESYEAAITAGVFLYRIYNWFLPIPLAWLLLKVARPGRSILPTTKELRTLAAGEPT